MTWVKIRTWFRIQRRMASFYWTTYFSEITWPLRFLINWVLVLLSPLWIGIVYLLVFVARGIQSRKNVERDVMSGKIWYWNQFKIY